MEDYYKLSQAAKFLNCDVQDLLKAGAEKKIKLHFWCETSAICISICDDIVSMRNQKSSWRANIQGGCDCSYKGEGNFYSVPPAILMKLYMSGNPKDPIPQYISDVSNVDVLRFGVCLFKVDFYQDSICILEKDLKTAKKMGLSSSSKKVVAKTSPYAFTDIDVTDWGAVAIRFTEFEKVEITLGKDIKSKCYDYESLGFSKKTKTGIKPNRHWFTLFLMANSGGNPRDPEKWPDLSPLETANSKQVSALKSQLIELFPTIDGDPWDDYRPCIGWSLIMVLDTHLITSGMNHSGM